MHSKALLVAVKLGLADHLHDRPLEVQELAQLVGARPDYLSRIVRALIGIGVFQEPSKGKCPASTCAPAVGAGNAHRLVAKASKFTLRAQQSRAALSASYCTFWG